MSAVVVVEINPCLFRAAGPDPLGPLLEFRVGIVVPIPPNRPVEPDVDLISRLDESVGQTGAMAGAEDDPHFPKGGVALVVPPALVPKFYGIAARCSELA